MGLKFCHKAESLEWGFTFLSDFDIPTECGQRPLLENHQGWKNSSWGILGKQASLDQTPDKQQDGQRQACDTGESIRRKYLAMLFCGNEQRLSSYRSDLLQGCLWNSTGNRKCSGPEIVLETTYALCCSQQPQGCPVLVYLLIFVTCSILPSRQTGFYCLLITSPFL